MSLLERIETRMRVLDEFRGQLHWGTNAARFKEFRYLFYYLVTAISLTSSPPPRPSGVQAALMSGFDANVIHTVPILGDRHLNAAGLDNASDTERLLLDFLTQFRVEGQFVYRYVTRSFTGYKGLEIRVANSPSPCGSVISFGPTCSSSSTCLRSTFDMSICLILN